MCACMIRTIIKCLIYHKNLALLMVKIWKVRSLAPLAPDNVIYEYYAI